MEKFRNTPPVDEVPKNEEGTESHDFSETIKVAEEEMLAHFDTYKNISDAWAEKKDQISDKWDEVVERHQQAYEEAVKNIDAITIAAGGISLYGSISAFAYAVGNLGIDSSNVRDGLAYGSAGFVLAVAIGALGLGSRGVAEGMKKINEWRDERGSEKEHEKHYTNLTEQTDNHTEKGGEITDRLNNLRFNSN